MGREHARSKRRPAEKIHGICPHSSTSTLLLKGPPEARRRWGEHPQTMPLQRWAQELAQNFFPPSEPYFCAFVGSFPWTCDHVSSVSRKSPRTTAFWHLRLGDEPARASRSFCPAAERLPSKPKVVGVNPSGGFLLRHASVLPGRVFASSTARGAWDWSFAQSYYPRPSCRRRATCTESPHPTGA